MIYVAGVIMAVLAVISALASPEKEAYKPDESESDMIGDAGIIQGVELETGRTCWTDRSGRKLCFEVRRRLSWRVWVLFAAVVAAFCWGIRAAI